MDPKEHLILYVDDEKPNRVVFEASFGRKYRVECVDSAEKALAILENEDTPVAVLVTDQRMPGISGHDLLERAKVLSPDTMRIVLTAYSDLEPILRAVNEGLVVRYIIKPWDRTELDRILEWALEVYEVGRTQSAIQLRVIQTERLLTLGQVAGAVVHDLRQPLAVIRGNAAELVTLSAVAPTLAKLAALAARDADPSIDREHLRLLDMLATELADMASETRDAVEFMNQVLTQLAQFHRREEPATQAQKADAVALLKLATSMCRQEAYSLGTMVINDCPERLPSIKIAPVHFLQIVINLVRNAAQACGRAGKGRRVILGAVEEATDVRFAIRDEGTGMSPEVLAKLSTPFFSTRPDGTGLGVGQVRRLVGGVGGKLDIDSAVGKGTTVAFTIPKA